MTAILVSILGFLLLPQLGVEVPPPRQISILCAVTGGILFGIGIVLAGGLHRRNTLQDRRRQDLRGFGPDWPVDWALRHGTVHRTGRASSLPG